MLMYPAADQLFLPSQPSWELDLIPLSRCPRLPRSCWPIDAEIQMQSHCLVFILTYTICAGMSMEMQRRSSCAAQHVDVPCIVTALFLAFPVVIRLSSPSSCRLSLSERHALTPLSLLDGVYSFLPSQAKGVTCFVTSRGREAEDRGSRVRA